MALYKEHGNFGTQLQSDYKYSHNGYGLLQLTANFKRDATYAAASDVKFDRGSSFPSPQSSGGPFAGGNLSTALQAESWTCIKAEETGSDGNIITVTAHYAAISLAVGGESSQIEATITASASSEAVETHPNFSMIQVPRISPENPLGGELGPDGPSISVTDYGTKKNMFRAKWLPSPTAGLQSYQFVGFLPAQKEGDEFNRKAGIKNYFRPTVTLKLTGYTTNAKEAVKATNYVGFSTKNGCGFLKVPTPYDQYLVSELDFQSNFDGAIERNWLCTSANMEVYGGMYKCTIDLMLSGIIGWDPDVYPAVE
jgi:hypothetical protein